MKVFYVKFEVDGEEFVGGDVFIVVFVEMLKSCYDIILLWFIFFF